jgi:dihydroorotase-like cyclic amidohydrolase
MIRLPGLIDPHVHLRTPGQTHKENFETGTKAAIVGGFTAVIDMPNNPEPTTTEERLDRKIKIAKEQIISDIGFHFGSLGDNFDEFEKVKDKVLGLKLYLNHTTGNFIINKESLTKIYDAWPKELPILVHAEEDVIDLAIEVCRKTNKKTHVCHVPDKKVLDRVISAKKEGLPITCGITPHHLFLGPEDAKKQGPFGLMKPPITVDYRDYFFENLEWIDIVESDHAPHTREEKESDNPPFGVPNLETTLGLLLRAVDQDCLSLDEIKRLCHSGPAEIFDIDQEAEIEVDENEEWIVEGKKLQTKCKWSPFEGQKLIGKVKKVWIRKELVFENDKFLVKPGFGKVLE